MSVKEMRKQAKAYIKKKHPLTKSILAYQNRFFTGHSQGMTAIEFCQKLAKQEQDTVKNKSILTEAESIVNGARAVDYGPKESFSKMATVHNALWGTNLVGKDFVKMLHTVKLVRESFKHKRDNLVDATGYLELLNRLEE